MNNEASERDPLEQVVDSFLARIRAGERPALSEYLTKHPELADDIRELFPALAVMEEGRKCVGEPACPDPARLSEAQVPKQLGEYRLLRQVGRGGTGVVHEASQVPPGRRGAPKTLTVNSPMPPARRDCA